VGKDKEFLRYTWPAIQEALAYLLKYDKNGRRPARNEGYPDQTYDTWVVRGESAYSGSLWLASLRSAEEKLPSNSAIPPRNAVPRSLQQRQASYIKKLWNAILPLRHRKRISRRYPGGSTGGQWYANMTGLGELVPRDHAGQFTEKNLCLQRPEIADVPWGQLTALLLTAPWSRTNEQVEKMWTGNLAVGSAHARRRVEGRSYRTAWGLYHQLRNEGLLVPHSEPGTFPEITCLHVHASRGHLGHGDDSPSSEIAFGRVALACFKMSGHAVLS